MTNHAPHASSTDALNRRIDKLVESVDALIAEVKRQARSRQRLTAFVGMCVMGLSLAITAVAWHQSRLDRQASCRAQNTTRAVVHDLLKSAQDAAASSQPPDGLSAQELRRYNDQLAQADAFYAAQLLKLTPLSC